MFMGIANKEKIQVHVSSAHFLFEVQVHGLCSSPHEMPANTYMHIPISV